MINALLALLVGCGELTTQDHWELIGINHDLSVLDARITTGNTGLLKGQGHVRVDWLFRDQTPVYHGRDGLADEVTVPERGGLMVGPDGLALMEDDSWRLQVRDAEAQAELSLVPQLGGPPAVVWTDGERSTTLSAPVVLGGLHGFLSSGSRSALVDARAVLTHRTGDATVALVGTRRLAVYVLGEGLTIGMDQTGGQALAWAVVGDLVFDARDARLTEGEKGRLVLDLRPTADLVVHVLPRRPRSIRHPWEHLHRLERWLLSAWHGTPRRRTQGAQARLLIGGEALEARAVILEQSWD